MRMSVRVLSVLILVWAMLLVAGCQPTSEAIENPEMETEAPQEEPAPSPTPEPTQPPTPEPTPVPTADPLDIRFGSSGYELFNIDGGGPVFSIAWAPDSSLLAMGGNANIVIWETRGLTRDAILEGHTIAIANMDWSPDGSTLASIDIDSELRLWDMATFTENLVFETGTGFCLAWSMDGNRIVVGTRDGQIQEWDIGNSQQAEPWNEPTGKAIGSIDWSPDGNWVAAGESSGIIYIWDVNNISVSETLDTYATELSPALDLAWAPNGSLLATAHQDGFLRLWDSQTWEVLHSIPANTDGVYKIAWAPDSYLLASGGIDNSVPIWDSHTGEKITGIGANTVVLALGWSPNGKMLAIGAAGMPTKPGTGSITGNVHTGFTEEEILERYEPNPEAGMINLWVRLK